MLTWCKPGVGCGRFMCNTEHVLVCRKGPRAGNPFGLGGQFAPATTGTWFNWPRGRHSDKPDAFFDIVERISPGPYLELFARRARPGWTVWGNEVESHAHLSGGEAVRSDELLAQFGPQLTPQEIVECIALSGEPCCQACGRDWKDHHQRCEGSANGKDEC